MSFPADDRYPGRTPLPHMRENPCFDHAGFPESGRIQERPVPDWPPAQYHDQLQCLRIFPHPGVPTATDGNSPHCGIFLPVPGAVLSLIREKPSLNRLKMGHSGASYRRFLKMSFYVLSSRRSGAGTGCSMPDSEKPLFFLEVRVCPTLT